MREIKFRGKRRTNGEFIYGYYVQFLYEIQGGDFPKDKICHSIIEANSRAEFLEEFIEVDPNTVGQFTGLTDKNGKEIYHGDICAFGNPNSGSYALGVIEYINGATKIRYIKMFKYGVAKVVGFGSISKKYEVIGDIHSNPELLKP